MNSLEVYFDHWIISQSEAIESMNYLQDRGAISDNAIDPNDVAEADAQRAVVILRDKKQFDAIKKSIKSR